MSEQSDASTEASGALARNLMTRREALQRVAGLLGGTLVGGTALLSGCRRTPSEAAQAVNGLFSAGDLALLDDITDTILPETGTPGAKSAQVGAFIALMVTDCYEERDQKILKEGLADLGKRCRQLHSTEFHSASPAQRTALLTTLDQEQHRVMGARQDGDEAQPAHYFRMLKELTLLGYFTSEIGCTQAQRYIETPGRYEPCVPYKPGEQAWAPPSSS